MFDDANAFAYLNDNKAGCIDHLKEMITQRCAKQVEVQLRLNEGGRSAANTVPDLRQLINFDIEKKTSNGMIIQDNSESSEKMK